MTESAFRATRNEAARARLARSLPAIFPVPVLIHIRARPWTPPTPRLAVDSYWRHHPLRADRLARALAARSGAPEGWTWRLDPAGENGLPASFRLPPAPYREAAHARGPGFCCVCGQPAFRFGWHRDLWGTGEPNRRTTWHPACVVAWKLWCSPSDHAKLLRKRQRGRCAGGGGRLLRTAEVDHREPLHRIWRERRDTPWPNLLDFWGLPNLQMVNRTAHAAKSAAESSLRAAERAKVTECPETTGRTGSTGRAKMPRSRALP